MGVAEMGRVTVEAKITSVDDAFEVEKGQRQPNEVRSIIVPDALVDTGATLLALPISHINHLGLKRKLTKRGRTASGVTDIHLYDPVRLEIMGRECTMDVMGLPDGSPTLIGQIPLELLDFVIDMREHKLIGNPAHNGEHMYDFF